MQVLLILGVFLLFCLVCGINTSAKSVARGADRIRSQCISKSTSPERPPRAAQEGRGSIQACMKDVEALFALYQSGALTREEFDEAKRHLLARLQTSA